MAYEFSCRDAGAAGCNWKTRAASEDELVAKIAQHVQKRHKVKNVTGTIANYARAAARQV